VAGLNSEAKRYFGRTIKESVPMSRINDLHDLGQSIWLDYIDRGLLRSGELKSLVDAGIRGVTSNPTIFQQAISSSDAYEEDLRSIAGKDKQPVSVFEELAIADIQNAADVLRPVYDASNAQDGFVSLEVAPDLAYDVEETIAEARRLRAAVDRPNLMIKVPATEPGVEAIRTLVADGLNINVTLIFALERYAAVMEAYLSGLEDRLANGLSLHQIASVASFFVSRVDTNVDGELDRIAEENGAVADKVAALKGKIAVANAKLAYREFQRTFSGMRWQALEKAGAQLQRPLWASTSTKNPSYPELLYVETLMGPHTVNTMPPQTLDAFRDHGVVARTVDQNVDEAERAMQQLAALGISLQQITDDLEREGVQKFADSYDELLDAIRQRIGEIVGTA
jgi:transaldolase